MSKPGFSTTVASALTNAGIDAVSSNLNLATLVYDYRGLVNSGQVQGRHASDFANWVLQTHLGQPISYNAPSETDLALFDSAPVQVASYVPYAGYYDWSAYNNWNYTYIV